MQMWDTTADTHALPAIPLFPGCRFEPCSLSAHSFPILTRPPDDLPTLQCSSKSQPGKLGLAPLKQHLVQKTAAHWYPTLVHPSMAQGMIKACARTASPRRRSCR